LSNLLACAELSAGRPVTQPRPCDFKRKVLTARVVFRHSLDEITAGGGQFASRPTELLKQEVGEAGVRRTYANGALQAFVMNEHLKAPFCMGMRRLSQH
jgi:hypothetical protein